MSAHLRRAVLAAVTLDRLGGPVEVSVDPTGGEAPHDRVVVVTDTDSGRSLRLSWWDVVLALGPWAADPVSVVAAHRLRALAWAAAVLARGGAAGLATALRVHAEPAGSPTHPGAAWTEAATGPIHAGWGVHVPWHPLPTPLPLAPSLHAALAEEVQGARGRALWRAAEESLHRLGRVATERLARDHAEGRQVVLRPVGGADVPTLLLAPEVRRWMADRDGTGVAALAAPTRARGWVDVRRIDPTFITAAFAATDSVERGFRHCLLVTRDDVVSPGGAD